MTKQILLVGEHSITETWAKQLKALGFETHEVNSVVEAIEYFEKPEHSGAHILTQENMPVTPMGRVHGSFPKEFDPETVDQYDRGEKLIRYLRERGLLTSDTPTFLMKHDTSVKCEGIKLIGIEDSLERLAQVITPRNYRPGSNSHSRG